MDDSTPVESRTKEPFEMDDQSFVSSDTYQADLDAGSQLESPGRSVSGRWHTTNSSNTMELERHLSASSVSRDVRASSVSNQRYVDSDRQDQTNMMSTQSEGQFYETDGTVVTSDRVHDFPVQTESAAFMPGHSAGQVFGENGTYRNLKGRYDSSGTPQSGTMVSTPPLDPTLMDHRTSRISDHLHGSSEQQEPTSLMPAANINHTYDDLRMSSSSDQRRGSSERLDPAHLMSTSEVEHRGRSPSSRPKVSAETKARWAMLKQLAGVSQPHDVEEEDRNQRRNEESRTMEFNVQDRGEASVQDSSQTGDHADDTSIERYLHRLQGDPNIDSRGLREGLSRMHSYKGSKGQQDQYLAQENHVEGDTHSDAQSLSKDTRNTEFENEMRRGEHDTRNLFHRGEGEAQQALRGREAGLRRDEHALGADLQRDSRRAEGEIRSASRDARGHLQNDKQVFERDARRDTSMADAEIHNLGGQTAREFRRGENGLESGIRGAAHAAESLLPHADIRQDLRRGEHELMGDVHKAENAFSHTEIGQEIRRGEHDIMGEVHKLDQEFPHIGLGQEIRKGEANLVGDIRKVENEMANTGLGQEVRKGEANLVGDIRKVENAVASTGLGQEIRKGEHHLVDEFHKLEHDLSYPGVVQDLQRGEHDLRQGLHQAADHLRKDEHALGRGAEAAGRSVEHGAELIGRSAMQGAAIAGGLGMMALDHAGSGETRSNVPQHEYGMINANGQRMPNNTHEPGAGGPRPPGAPGAHPALNFQRPNQSPANNQTRPSIVEPPHHPPTNQTPQPGHNRGPSGSQQSHLSPTPSPAKAPSPGSPMNKSPPGSMSSPIPGNIQRSQTPVRKPVLPPRPQGSPQQRPSSAMPPHPQPQHPQAAPQHSQVQNPQNAPQRSPLPQHPQGAPKHPPQPPHPQGAQLHPKNTTPQHSQPPQPPPPQGAPQRPQNTMSQPPHPRGTPQQKQPPNAMPQHLPPQQPLSAPQHPPNAMPQHPQPPHPREGPQQSHPPSTMPQHPQPPHPQGGPQQKQSGSAMPQHPPPPQGAPMQRSQSPMSPHTQALRTQGTSQRGSPGPTPPHPQVSHPQAPQQRIPNAITQPQPQKLPGTPNPRLPNDPREEEGKRSEAMPHRNVRQIGQATSGAAAGPHLARTQPLANERPISEGKTDEQEPRASIMQERRRRAADARRRLADRQEQQNKIDCRHEDHDADSCPYQTERHATTEHTEESRSISGPQSMLNMFKARADAAIEASGDCPSFTDRLLIEMIQLLCNMAQDAMPEIERRLAQNQRQDCS